MKFTITSVIPVAQYANIQPSMEVEAETLAEAQAIVEPQMLALWQKYSPGTLKVESGNSKRLTAFVGGEIDYDEVAHVYTWNGEVYQSGSQYAETFRKPFDKHKIAGIMASKIDDCQPAEIIDMWELKSQVSRDFGNAIHKALQLYEQYNGVAEALNKTTHSHDHPVIKTAVDGFMEAHKGENALSEVLVVDHKNKRAGQIDRLLIIDGANKICQVQDFKTNADIAKELDVYWKQLQFYGSILKEAGWTLKPPKIFHYDGSWHEYTPKG